MSPASRHLTSQTQVRQFVESLKNKRVIIYGGGKIGTRVCRSLRNHGVQPAAIWDIRHAIIRNVDGIPVVAPQPESVGSEPDVVVLVTVYSENVCRSIATDLKSRGVSQVVYRRTLINAILYLECHHLSEQDRFVFDVDQCHLCPVAKDANHRCDIFSRHVAATVGVSWPAPDAGNPEPCVIPSMGVLVTNHCNLTCQGCNHLRDLYRPEDNVRLEVDQILVDCRAILGAVDFIEKLVVVGGEAFVHKELDVIVARLLELPKVGLVQLITNGTVLPKSRRVFEVLANARVLVEVSGYGPYLPEELQEKLREFLAVLQAYGIRHRHLETLEWQDFGDFRHRGYSARQHQAIYDTCCFVSNDLFDGKLFKCSRSVFATRLGRIPGYPGDYVDVRATPPEQLRQRIVEFLQLRTPEVCQHCNGTTNQRIPAGMQVSGGAVGEPLVQLDMPPAATVASA